MTFVLGIDTGGTYTDSVIFDNNTHKIISFAKALTTPDNFVKCISDSVNNLKFTDMDRIVGVALSTTLATNSIVEGKGGEVALIQIGGELTCSLPTDNIIRINGGHNVSGKAVKELDRDEIAWCIERIPDKVSAVAVSGYFSVRNPEHELFVRDMIKKECSLPVACAHQLTTALGFNERTVTCILNAGLISVITKLINSVKKVLADKNINVPIMVVKGDGTLMSEEFAEEKPIETILSGPAASIIGGIKLADTDRALILDMGGTTTDIAIVDKGMPKLNKEGAEVGGWHTRVKSAEIYTYGLGGDSHIHVLASDNTIISKSMNSDINENITVGQEKVIPFYRIIDEHPHLLNELKYLKKRKKQIRAYDLSVDCFIYSQSEVEVINNCSDIEKEIIAILKERPHSYGYLKDKGNFSRRLNEYLNTLVKKNIIKRISLTPTDIIILKGLYNIANDKELIITAVEILSLKLGINSTNFIETTFKKIIDDLTLCIIRSLIKNDENCFEPESLIENKYLIKKLLNNEQGNIFNLTGKLEIPVVAIGAPVSVYLPMVSEKLNSELVIPEFAEVANAYGAAKGSVVKVFEISIMAHEDAGIAVHTPWDYHKFQELEEAKKFAFAEGVEHAEEYAERTKIKDYKITTECNDIYVGQGNNDAAKVFIESKVKITLNGQPNWY